MRAAGKYSTTTLSTLSLTETVIDYSYVAYTYKDTSAYLMISSFPTASSIRTNIEVVTSILEPVYTPGQYPTCDDSAEIAALTCDPKNCTISAYNVQLIYWPVSTVPGYPNLTVTSNATEPVTAVVNGTTFTSPTVYLSYDGVFAIDDCTHDVGKSHPGAILGLNPDAVSSIASVHEPPTKFNFADLNKPYSPDVLLQMCFPEPVEYCGVGVDDIYYPRLAVPEEIRTLDPAWKNCNPDWLGSFDPPRILTPAQALVQPTSAADVKPTSSIATPAHTVMSQGAASTSTLDAGIISVASSSIQEHPAKDTPAGDPSAQNSPARNPSTKAEPAQSHSVRDPLTTNPSEHNSPAQRTPETNLPINDPPANDPSSNDLSANDPSAKKSPANDPPAKTLPENVSSIKSTFINEIPASPWVENSHINDPKVVLPFITVESQGFTADPPSHYDIDSQTLAPGGTITGSGTPISMSPIRLPAEVSPSSLPVLVVGPQSFTANSISQYIIDSQTLKPGGQITVSGTSISAPALPVAVTISNPTLPPLLIASKTYSANSAFQYVIASQTLTPNGNIVVSGTTISLLPSASALVIGSTTKALKPSFKLPPLVLGSEAYTADSNSQYIINSQTLSPGGHITMSGTSIFLASQPSALESEDNLNLLFSRFALPSLTIGSNIYTANQASAYKINDQTLTPGAQITVDGTPVSLAPQASALVLGSRTERLVPSFALPTLKIASTRYTANPASAYVINGQTLTPGGQISVDGTTVSLAPQASAADVGSRIESLSFVLPTLTIFSDTYTANLASAYVIDGQTLFQGGQISVNGTPISLAPEASALVIGSTTEPLSKSFALPPITIGLKIYTAISTSAYIIKGQTLTPGGQITADGMPISVTLDASAVVIGGSTESWVPASSKFGLGWFIMEGFNNRGSNSGGSDVGNESTASITATGVSGSPERSTVTSVSVTSTTVTDPTQTTAVFARGARWRWSRTWIGFGAALSTILSTLN